MEGEDGIINYKGEPVTLVGNTVYGDGEFYDNQGITYSVDAGNIGVVNLDYSGEEYTLEEFTKYNLGKVVDVTSEEVSVVLSNEYRGIRGNFYISIDDPKTNTCFYWGIIPTGDDEEEEEDYDYSDEYDDGEDEEEYEESNPFRGKLRESEEMPIQYYFLYKDRNEEYYQEDGIYKDLPEALEDVAPDINTESGSLEEILDQVKKLSKRKGQIRIIGIADDDSILLEPQDLYDDIDKCFDFRETVDLFDDLKAKGVDFETWDIYEEDYVEFDEPNSDREWEEHIW